MGPAASALVPPRQLQPPPADKLRLRRRTGRGYRQRPAAGSAAAMAAMRQPSIRSAQYMEDASFEIVPQPRVARSSRQSADDMMRKTPDNVDSSGTPKSNRKTNDTATATTAKSASVRSDRLRDPKEIEDEKKKRAKDACSTPTCIDNDGDDQEEEGESEELVACESGEMNKGSIPIGSGGDVLADGDSYGPGRNMAPKDNPLLTAKSEIPRHCHNLRHIGSKKN